MDLRKPAWRRELAEEYAKEAVRVEDVPFRRKEDALVRKMVEYLIFSRAHRAASRMEKRRLFPRLQEAYELYCREDPFADKWLIEALALGGVPYQKIAEEVMVEPELAEMYCLCFFDVAQKETRDVFFNNLRRLCSGEGHVMMHNYGWKLLVVNFGLDMFRRVVLNRKEMGGDERRNLDEMRANAAAILGWWAVEKRSMMPDLVPSEREMLLVRQNVDLAAPAGKDTSSKSAGNLVADEISGILDSVRPILSVVDATKVDKRAAEPRLA